jgi:hypothetical protein
LQNNCPLSPAFFKPRRFGFLLAEFVIRLWKWLFDVTRFRQQRVFPFPPLPDGGAWLPILEASDRRSLLRRVDMDEEVFKANRFMAQ